MAKLFLCVMAIFVLHHVNATDKTLGQDCTVGTDVCTNAHSVCQGTGGSTGGTSCECDTGYTVDGTTQCKANTGSDCTAGTDVCTDTNAACGGTAGTSGSATCVCNIGYYDVSGTCTAAVSSACTSDSDCTGRDFRTTCTSSACACASGYYSNSGFCALVLGSTCTHNTAGNTMCETTRAVANSECTAGLQCVCKSGYQASNDLTSCIVSSGAGLIQPNILTLILFVLTALYRLV